MTTSADKFRKTLRNIEAIYRRLDSNVLTGRNSVSTEASLAKHVKTLRSLISEDAHSDTSPLCDLLDSDAKLAARWDRVERRYYGLPS